MYRCSACDKEFEEPKQYPGMYGEFWGKPFQEHYKGCPYCKSDDIFEIVFRCACCNFGLGIGDIYYETKDGSRYCEECIIKKEVDS